MPSAQVVDIGGDPFAETMGNFAKNFGNSFLEANKQRKNEDIFKKIRQAYGPETPPEDMLRDILQSEGMDQSYKKDLIGQIKDYGVLKSKKGLNPYQQVKLDNDEKSLKLRTEKQDAAKTAAEAKQAALLPDKIASYTDKIYKDEARKPSVGDKTEINKIMHEAVTKMGMSIPEAFEKATEYMEFKKQKIDQAKISGPPKLFLGGFAGGITPEEKSESMTQAFNGLSDHYDQGITDEKDLKKIAKKALWDDKDINTLVSKVFQSKGKTSRLTPVQKQEAMIEEMQQEVQDSPEVMERIKGFFPNAPTTPAEKVIELGGGKEQKPKEAPGLYESFKSGLAGSVSGGATGELAENAGFWSGLAYSAGELIGDAPYIAAGATLGAALGAEGGPLALATGSAGAFMLPTFLKESLKEYRKYAKNNEDDTYLDFLNKAASGVTHVGSETLKSGAFGVILGAITKAGPALKNLPGIGSLFNTKVGQTVGVAAAETAAIGAIPSLTKGELPTAQDFAHATALVLGMRLTHLPAKIREKLNRRGKESGLTPEEFAKTPEAKEILEEKIAETPVEKAVEEKPKEKTAAQEAKDILEEFNAPEEARSTIEKVLKEKEFEKEKFTEKQDEIEKEVEIKQKEYNEEKSKTEDIENEIQGEQVTEAEFKLLQKRLNVQKAREAKKKKALDLDKKRLYASKTREAKDIKSFDPKIEKIIDDYEEKQSKNVKSLEDRLERAKEKGDEKQVKLLQKNLSLQKAREAKKNKTTKPVEKPEPKEKTASEEAKNILKKVNNSFVLEKAREVKKVKKSNEVEDLQDRIDEVQAKLDKSKNEANIRILAKNLTILNKKLKKAKEKKKPKPITEETGEGIEKRLDYPKTASEKAQETMTNLVEVSKNPNELAHQVYTKAFDALHPIRRLEESKNIPIEERVTTRIKQAQSSASDINNVLEHGIFDRVHNTFSSGSLKDAYIDAGNVWNKFTRDMKPQEYSVQEMDIYRQSKEALKRQKRGLKSGVDTEIAKKDVERLKEKYGPIDQRIKQFQTKLLERYAKDLLSPETRAQWAEDSHASLYRAMDYGENSYVKQGSLQPKKPWYKAKGSQRKILPASETDAMNISMLISNSKKNDSILQYKRLVEQGKLPGKIVKSKNLKVPEGMMKELEIGNKQLAETLYNQSRKNAFSPEEGRIRGWENGKAFEIEVPKDVYETYSSMAPADTGMFVNAFEVTNRIFSKGIVLEPVKAFSIFSRDALSSLIYSKTGSNPMSIVKALTEIYQDSPAYQQYKSMGGDTYASRLMTRADRIAKVEDLLRKETKATIIPQGGLVKFMKEFNNRLSASVPFAEYQRALKVYGDTPSGRLQSLLSAKEVTYDPGMRGSSKVVRSIGNVSPFFNVTLQEPVMLTKNILNNPQFIAKGIIGITLPTLALKLFNDGNPDYDDMNPILKASCWHFYTDAGHYALPIPWLLGAVFKAGPELLYDVAKGEGGDAWKGLYSYVASQFAPSFPPLLQALVEQSTERSLKSPIGVLLSPVVDIEGRAPEVVPRRLQNLPKEQQYTSSTSQLARWYGNLWGASPVKVERLIRGFGGGVAGDVLALIDEMAYQSGLVEDLRQDKGMKNYLLMGKFLYENTPRNTKYTEQFYNKLEEARLNKQRGLENDDTVLQRYNKKISQQFKAYRAVEEEKMDASQKREELLEIQKNINELYKQAVQSVTKE